MKSRISRNHHARGFSLVELLVTIGVLGVITAISIIAINPVTRNAHVNKDMRNAQSIAAVAGASQAAGAVLDLSSLDSAIAQLKEGVSGSGTFSSSTFKVAPFTSEQVEDLRPYLSIQNNSLVFTQQ